MARTGFFGTWAAATFKPGAFFAQPAAERSSWSPLGFALVIAAISGPLSALTTLLAMGQSLSVAGRIAGGEIVGNPFRTLLFIYISGALTHLALILVGGRPQPFKQTRDCICYCTAPMLFGIVPIAGMFIAFFWSVVILSIGLAAAHQTSAGKGVFAAVAPTLSLVVLFVGLRVFVIEAFNIPAGSMAPTVQAGDHIFINKLVYRFSPPKRGDVIVFKYPEDPDKDFIKRVIGVEGDTVEIRRGHVYVNGAALPRNHRGFVQYIDYTDDSPPPERHSRDADEWEETLDGKAFQIYTEVGESQGGCRPPARFGCGEPAKVPPSSVYVMGDNRDNSHDSRFWGFVPVANIKGRASWIWYSENPTGGTRWNRMFHAIR